MAITVGAVNLDAIHVRLTDQRFPQDAFTRERTGGAQLAATHEQFYVEHLQAA